MGLGGEACKTDTDLRTSQSQAQNLKEKIRKYVQCSLNCFSTASCGTCSLNLTASENGVFLFMYYLYKPLSSKYLANT